MDLHIIYYISLFLVVLRLIHDDQGCICQAHLESDTGPITAAWSTNTFSLLKSIIDRSEVRALSQTFEVA